MKVKSEKLKVKSYFQKLLSSHFSVLTSKYGFTLIELVITMVLIGIVAYVVANAMATGFRTYFKTDFRKEAMDQARIAMERMTREIRNLQGSTFVGTGIGSQFCFTNTDGATLSFRYPGLSADTIARQDGLANLAACPGAAGNTLSNNITNMTFSYIRLDGTSDAVFSAANTKRIRIIITSTVSGEVVTLQSEVWPRNL